MHNNTLHRSRAALKLATMNVCFVIRFYVGASPKTFSQFLLACGQHMHNYTRAFLSFHVLLV